MGFPTTYEFGNAFVNFSMAMRIWSVDHASGLDSRRESAARDGRLGLGARPAGGDEPGHAAGVGLGSQGAAVCGCHHTRCGQLQVVAEGRLPAGYSVSRQSATIAAGTVIDASCRDW